jgi:hypothetical protein
VLEGTPATTHPETVEAGLIGSARTVIEASYPGIPSFRGPCTIRVYERPRYWSKVTNGWAGIWGLWGFLEPLCWAVTTA